MKIAFYPLDLFHTNSYISIICQSIQRISPLIEIQPLTITKSLNLPKHTNIFWLNWYENIDCNSFSPFFKNLILKIVYFIRMKGSTGKVIVVFHNKRPHEIYYEKITLWFMRFLLRNCDRIIILCSDSIDVINKLAQKNLSKKMYKISHPCYLCTPKIYLDAPDKCFKILFAGLLRPYKNIELLLNIAQKHPELEFIISGKPIDNTYANFLLQNVKKLSNVTLELKYNSDKEFELLMDNATVLVLPYHLYSTLNSGVAMFAFSKGINVIMPKIGTVTELDNQNLVFSYTYEKESEHFEKLEKKIIEAYSLHNTNYNEFIRRAKVIRNEVLHKFSVESISKQIQGLIQDI